MDCIVCGFDDAGNRIVSYRCDVPSFDKLASRVSDIRQYVPDVVRVTIDLALDPR